jgi:anti-sigma factor ChrR (cupin superfamily)
MQDELVNADFSRRVAIATRTLPWTPSPQPGVERRLLDRIGGEVARATSLVRYAPASKFPPHEHGLGEEFLVLEGVFSDEHGDYPAGTYVRNPPNSRHAPRTAPGCIILVKLRQMPLSEHGRTVVDTAKAKWRPGERDGHTILDLYSSAGERVTLERLAAGAALPVRVVPGGEEIFIVSGELTDAEGRHGAETWIRNPDGYRSLLRSESGAVYWAKRGHLPETRKRV